ncbi:MAG: hypothetical protein ACRDFW_13280 [bacterium]
MLRRVLRTFGRAIRGIGGAVRANRRIFITVVLAVLLVNILLPPTVLSIVRKPWDHFSFNPWLRNLPAWLASDEATLGRKLEFLTNAALYWFIANGPADAAEWGYTATVRDVARWLFLSLVFGTYFALWYHRRSQVRACPPGAAGQGGRRAGVAGAVLSTLGFSTLPCSVVGCGAPVLPVLGLAISGLGLSAATLGGVNRISQAIATLVLLGMILGIVHLIRLVTSEGDERLALAR